MLILFIHRVAVKDSQGLQSEIKVLELRVCNTCNGHGSCDYSNSAEEIEIGYLVPPCICDAPWTGMPGFIIFWDVGVRFGPEVHSIMSKLHFFD